MPPSDRKIAYVDGFRFHRAVVAGARAVVGDQAELNRINVFPVPDGDTGSNLAATVVAASEGVDPERSLSATANAVAEAALLGARGNSGLIFAQYLHGVARELGAVDRASSDSFVDVLSDACRYAWEALSRPVRGTLPSVLEDWAGALRSAGERVTDLAEAVPRSLDAARRSLEETPKHLEVLAKAGVVDAGAKGFVTILEGIVGLIRRGNLRQLPVADGGSHVLEPSAHELSARPAHRYCTEAVLVGPAVDPSALRADLEHHGDSVLVGSHGGTARIHLHTNHPPRVFADLERHGSFRQPKVDDMVRQVDAAMTVHPDVALVTDSACDLPQEVLDEHGIYMLPTRLQFGESTYLDKLSLTPDRFYDKLEREPHRPTTSQVPTVELERLYRSLLEHYREVVAIQLSGALSGTWNSSRLAAERVAKNAIHVVDSRHLCVSQGLLVWRAAEAVREGRAAACVAELVESWIPKAHILVAVRTVREMVRGGRLSRIQGWVARALNLKPIISVDERGRGTAFGRGHSQRGVRRQIERRVFDLCERGGLWRYAVVHAHVPDAAAAWAEDLTVLLGEEPAYVMDISPVIGLNAGIGSVAVGLMIE